MISIVIYIKLEKIKKSSLYKKLWSNNILKNFRFENRLN